MFKFSGFVEADGSWNVDADVPNGTTVTYGDFIDRFLVPCLAQMNGKRAGRLPTIAEALAIAAQRAAACALPPGWSVSLDGCTTHLAVDTNARHFSVAFDRDDGARCVAPCNADKSPVPETRTALLAYDDEHPRNPIAEA